MFYDIIYTNSEDHWDSGDQAPHCHPANVITKTRKCLIIIKMNTLTVPDQRSDKVTAWMSEQWIRTLPLWDLLCGGACSKRTTICSDASPAEEAELNMRRWITRGNDTQRCPLLPADGFIFNYLRQMFPGLPFLRKVAVTKLIHIIIERGFNEGEMFLTFECHSLPPPAVLRLLGENGYAVTAICGSFHQNASQQQRL